MFHPRDQTRLRKREIVPEAEQHASMKIVADDSSRWNRQAVGSVSPVATASEPAESSQGVLNHSSFDGWLSTFTPNTGTAVEMPVPLEQYELHGDSYNTKTPAKPKPHKMHHGPEPPAPHEHGSTSIDNPYFPRPFHHNADTIEPENSDQITTIGGSDEHKISTVAPKDPMPQDIHEKQHPFSGAEYDGAITLTIRGLKKDSIVQISPVAFKISPHITLTQLNHLIARKGYARALGIRYASNTKILEAMQGISKPCPVIVTSGPSNYCVDTGLRISIDERMENYLGRLRNLVECADNQLSLNRGDLVIQFHRTVQIPEDHQAYDCQLTSGNFLCKVLRHMSAS